MQQRNLTIFLAMSFLLVVGWVQLHLYLSPPPPPLPKDELTADRGKTTPKLEDKRPEPAPEKAKVEPKPKDEEKKPPVAKPNSPARKPGLQYATADTALRTLPADIDERDFYLKVQFDPRGAGVRSVTLTKFKAADAEGQPEDKPLELIPAAANRFTPADLLLHYERNKKSGNSSEEYPVDTLAHRDWDYLPDESKTEDVDGLRRQTIAFRTEIDGVRITKRYSLTERSYHLGLEVQLEGNGPFRYQLSGSRGLPIEGQWYTSIFRNALIGRIHKINDTVDRSIQLSQKVSEMSGGDAVVREDGLFLRYAVIVNQYFATGIVVDNNQEPGVGQEFLAKARPTLERTVVKGELVRVADDHRGFTIKYVEGVGFLGNLMGRTPVTEEFECYLAYEEGQPRELEARWKVGTRCAALVHFDANGTMIADQVVEESATQALFENDMTMRVATEPLQLEAGKPLVHRYLLYNGPVKPSLLGQFRGEDKVVPAALVTRYADDLGLNTMTDYHSDSVFGRISNAIYWAPLLIKVTNLMHWVLGMIHRMLSGVPGSYGLSIILLTILVRGMMFPLSRKGAMTSLRTQELAPELKKLKEKFKDDQAAFNVAQMELYRKNGVNPFGTCWFMLIQMPIFMGLYFALQESIFFRLGSFLWIRNLSAPDMMIRWGDNIPWMSRPGDYGWILYLGPYFNLLPLIAVSFMMVQQKMMTPPPTDEQQEMQQKMMKYMMLFMALMFYKYPAGLALYFIASSVWGFAERLTLPKKKPILAGVSPDTSGTPRVEEKENTSIGLRLPAAVTITQAATALTVPKGRGRKKSKQRAKGAAPAVSTNESSPAIENGGPLARVRSWWRDRREKLSTWWQEVLKEAEKKQR